MEATLELDAVPQSAGEARRFVRGCLEDWSVEVSMDEVVLMVSELVTNVGLHAGTKAEVRLTFADGRLRVEVSDGSADQPELRPPPANAETGRGLLIVDALADDWGIRPSPPGKVVWFEMVIDTAA